MLNLFFIFVINTFFATRNIATRNITIVRNVIGMVVLLRLFRVLFELFRLFRVLFELFRLFRLFRDVFHKDTIIVRPKFMLDLLGYRVGVEGNTLFEETVNAILRIIWRALGCRANESNVVHCHWLCVYFVVRIRCLSVQERKETTQIRAQRILVHDKGWVSLSLTFYFVILQFLSQCTNVLVTNANVFDDTGWARACWCWRIFTILTILFVSWARIDIHIFSINYV